MDYVITNPNKKVYIRLNENGLPETCTKQTAQRFENSKARNILDNLPKPLKKFHFKVEPLLEIKQKEDNKISEKKSLENYDYVPSEDITRWIEKFGTCGDIIIEAEEREKQLLKKLDDTDNELLDILHIIEIEKPKDLFGGWQLYRRIRNNRRERRSIKDELFIVENVLKEIKDVSCLHRKQIKKAIDGLFTRKYTFRVVEEEEKNASM